MPISESRKQKNALYARTLQKAFTSFAGLENESQVTQTEPGSGWGTNLFGKQAAKKASAREIKADALSAIAFVQAALRMVDRDSSLYPKEERQRVRDELAGVSARLNETTDENLIKQLEADVDEIARDFIITYLKTYKSILEEHLNGGRLKQDLIEDRKGRLTNIDAALSEFMNASTANLNSTELFSGIQSENNPVQVHDSFPENIVKAKISLKGIEEDIRKIADIFYQEMPGVDRKAVDAFDKIARKLFKAQPSDNYGLGEFGFNHNALFTDLQNLVPHIEVLKTKILLNTNNPKKRARGYDQKISSQFSGALNLLLDELTVGLNISRPQSSAYTEADLNGLRMQIASKLGLESPIRETRPSLTATFDKSASILNSDVSGQGKENAKPVPNTHGLPARLAASPPRSISARMRAIGGQKLGFGIDENPIFKKAHENQGTEHSVEMEGKKSGSTYTAEEREDEFSRNMRPTDPEAQRADAAVVAEMKAQLNSEQDQNPQGRDRAFARSLSQESFVLEDLGEFSDEDSELSRRSVDGEVAFDGEDFEPDDLSVASVLSYLDSDPETPRSAGDRSMVQCIREVCQESNGVYVFGDMTNTVFKAVGGTQQKILELTEIPPDMQEQKDGSLKLVSMKIPRKSKANPMPCYESMKVCFQGLQKKCEATDAGQAYDIRYMEVDLDKTVYNVDQFAQVFLAYNEVFNKDYRTTPLGGTAQYITDDNAFDNAASFKGTKKFLKLMKEFTSPEYKEKFAAWLDKNGMSAERDALVRARNEFVNQIQNTMATPILPPPAKRSRFGF